MIKRRVPPQVEQDIRRNVPSTTRRLPEGPLLLTPGDVPTADPPIPLPVEVTDATKIFSAELWLGIQFVVIADAATSAGKTVNVRPWYYYGSLYDGSEDGTEEGRWVPGELISDIPLDSTGSAAQIKNLEVANADQFYLQIVELSGSPPDWLRIYLYGLVPRKHAVPGLAVLFGESADGGSSSAGGTFEVKDEGVSVRTGTSILNFIGEGVLATADTGNADQVNVYIPPLEFSPYLGGEDGALSWPAVSPGYISTPETAEGDPYYTNGWADNVGGKSRIKETAPFASGLGITHTSARVTGLESGSITVVITDGAGNVESVTLTLDPAGGDQDATSTGGNLAVHVRDTEAVGPTIEGKVYVWANIPGFLALNSAGSGGYFNLAVNHTGAPVSADFGNAFWDAGVTPNGSDNPTIAVQTAQTKWLSGVPYYTENTTFDIEDSTANGVNDVVNMTIDEDKDVLLVDVSEFNTTVGNVNYDAATISGLTYGAGVSPVRTEKPSYAETITVGAGNHRVSDARVYTTWHNFHGNEAGSPKASSAAGINIDTWAVTATAQIEYFDDEAYRLQDEDYRVTEPTAFEFSEALANYQDWVGAGGGDDLRDWDSTQNIDSGSIGHVEGAQVGGGVLQYPTVNYTSGRLPLGPDYSGLTSDRFYYRAFFVGDTLLHKNFELALNVTGYTTDDIYIGLDGDDSRLLRLDIKFPGPNKSSMDGSNSGTYPGSGWLHCGKDFNYPDFTGIDGNGALTSASQSGNVITLSLTTKNLNTEYCDGILIVRVRMKDTTGASKTVNSMSLTGL